MIKIICRFVRQKIDRGRLELLTCTLTKPAFVSLDEICVCVCVCVKVDLDDIGVCFFNIAPFAVCKTGFRLNNVIRLFFFFRLFIIIILLHVYIIFFYHTIRNPESSFSRVRTRLAHHVGPASSFQVYLLNMPIRRVLGESSSKKITSSTYVLTARTLRTVNVRDDDK